MPDGSKVHLNSGSTLSFPDKFQSNIRQVKLEGEAFFEVYRNEKKPFRVSSGKILTTVLGTSFNVSDDLDKVRVTVESGKVEVSHKDKEKKIIINKGEQVIFSFKSGEFTSSRVNAGIYTCWRNGLLYFDEVPLGQAIKKIESWYNVHIECQSPDILNRVVRGKYQEQSVQTILNGLGFMFDFQVDYKNDSVIIIK